MHQAAYHGAIELVEGLAKLGADARVTTTADPTALHSAIRGLMFQKGPDPRLLEVFWLTCC
jgi:hypothetical protein